MFARIKIWWMRRSADFWQEQAAMSMNAAIQYRAKAAEVERQIKELGA